MPSRQQRQITYQVFVLMLDDTREVEDEELQCIAMRLWNILYSLG